MSLSKSKKISLKKLVEFNTIWHEDSRLVFKSKEETVVIGKFENGKIQPLKEEDIDACEKLRFKYEIVAVKKEDVVEETVEEEEEEVEETEETAEEEEVEETVEAEEEVEEGEDSVEAEEAEAAEAEEAEEEVDEELVEGEQQEVTTEEEKEEEKIERKPQPTSSSLTTTSSDDFTKSIQTTVDIWLKAVEDIKTLQNNLKSKTADFDDLHAKHEALKVEYKVLQENFDKMSVKLASIQKLFS